MVQDLEAEAGRVGVAVAPDAVEVEVGRSVVAAEVDPDVVEVDRLFQNEAGLVVEAARVQGRDTVFILRIKLNNIVYRSGSAVSKRSRSGSRSRSRSKSKGRSRSKSGSPTPRKKRLAILSDSEDDDGQPKLKKARPKITDSDHEGEENEPKAVVREKVEGVPKAGDSSGDEGIDDRGG